MIRARRSVVDGRRSASPAFSSASTVTTIVVLSMSPSSAIWICVRSCSAALTSTQCMRAVMPTSARAAAIRVRSTCEVWSSRNDRSGAEQVAMSPRGAGASEVIPAFYPVGAPLTDLPEKDCLLQNYPLLSLLLDIPYHRFHGPQE